MSTVYRYRIIQRIYPTPRTNGFQVPRIGIIIRLATNFPQISRRHAGCACSSELHPRSGVCLSADSPPPSTVGPTVRVWSVCLIYSTSAVPGPGSPRRHRILVSPHCQVLQCCNPQSLLRQAVRETMSVIMTRQNFNIQHS
jgi:hypothetical protein